MIVPQSDDLEFGEQTLVQLHAHLPMMVKRPSRTTVPQRAVAVDDEVVRRLEEKLDLAIRQIALLQQRLESMDLTLARVLSR